MTARMVLDRPRGRFVITPALTGYGCKHCTGRAVATVTHRRESIALCDDCLNLDLLGKW